MTPERSVKNKIVKRIKELQASGEKIYYEPREAGGYTYRKGIPDIWVCYYGKHIEIEIKAPGGEMSTMQFKWKQIFDGLGIPCYCISSVKEFNEILKENQPGL